MGLGRRRSLVLLGGLALLAWGLAALHGVFRQERSEALAALDAERDFLEVRARREIERGIETALEGAMARRERALADPRVAAEDLLDWQGGRQRLPRVFRHRPEEASSELPVESLYEAVLEGRLEAGATEEESPWTERRHRILALREAIRSDSAAAITAAFKDWLEHQVNWRIDSARDLGSALAVLEFFVRDGDPHPDLVRRLLCEGVGDGRGGKLPPLGRQLLESRSRLTRGDFDFLLGCALRVAERAGVDLAAVEARAREEQGRELGFEPSWLSSSRALWDGRWFVENRGEQAWVGVAVDLEALGRRVGEELAESSGKDFEVEVVAPRDGAGLEELELRTSIGWGELRTEIEQRHRLKAGLLGFTALLALAMAAFSIRDHQRRARLARLQSDFVAAVSHELKTPLASVRLLAETLERKIGKDPAARDYPQRMIRAVDGLHFLVDNILSFNRLDRSPTPVRREQVDLGELLERVEAAVAESSPRPLRVDWEAEGDGRLEADPRLLELVLLNLVRNATLYNDRPEAEVRVRLERRPGKRLLRVEDNGWGFPEAERELAFQRFWRGKDPSRPKVAGTGLGLAICRMVVELHGGRIELTRSSEAGSCFSIELPAVDSTPPEA